MAKPKKRIAANDWRISSVTLLSLAVAVMPITSAFGSFTSFDFPGAEWTSAASINNSGVIAGYANDYPQIAFVRTPDGSMTQISVPGTQSASANDINDNGTVTGWGADVSGYVDFIRASDGTITTFNPNPPSSAVVWKINDEDETLGNSLVYPTFVRESDGTFKDIKIDLGKGTKNTTGTDINDKQTITGYVYQQVHHATSESRKPRRGPDAFGFLLSSDGTVTTFQGPNFSRSTKPCCINNKGWIVGNYVDVETGMPFGFLRMPDGSLISIDVGEDTVVTGVNDKGAIIGTAKNEGRYRGFLRRLSGKTVYFDAQDGCMATYPRSINRSGEIVGTYTDAKDIFHGFVGSP